MVFLFTRRQLWIVPPPVSTPAQSHPPARGRHRRPCPLASPRPPSPRQPSPLPACAVKRNPPGQVD